MQLERIIGKDLVFSADSTCVGDKFDGLVAILDSQADIMLGSLQEVDKVEVTLGLVLADDLRERTLGSFEVVDVFNLLVEVSRGVS